MNAREALAEAEAKLAEAGVETPRADAEWLVAHLLGTTRSGLGARLDDEVDGLEPLLVRREAASRSPTYSASGASAGSR